jgi:hypothetical protein
MISGVDDREREKLRLDRFKNNILVNAMRNIRNYPVFHANRGIGI